MEKPYAVVYFIEQKSYSEIPSNWLLSTDESTEVTRCKWPPPMLKNLNFQLKNRVTPPDHWPTYEVKLLRYCDSLNQARKAAEDSDYSASEGPQGKGHRSKFLSATAAAAATSKYSLTDISSDDENDKNGNGKKPATEMPKMNKKIQKTTPMIPPTSRIDRSDKEHPNNNDQSLEVQSSGNNMTSDTLSDLVSNKNNNLDRIKRTKNDEFSKGITLINDHGTSVDPVHDDNIIDGDDNDDDNRFHTINDKLDSCLRLLGTLMVDIKDLKQRTVANNDSNNGEITEIESIVKNDLPLNSREEVCAFNAKLLESKDDHREFVRVVKQVGGASGKEYTERVLNVIFSTTFAADNSWEGKKTKFKLNNLKVIETCEEVILKKFPSWDRAEFSKTGINWFRLGNQRARLQKGQVQKQKKLEDDRIKEATA